MKEQTIFDILHNMDQVTNNLIIQWQKVFDVGLGITHILILGHLKTEGPTKPSELAKTLGLTPPTLTHLSEKLVQGKYAKRTTSEKDRRVIYLKITKRGEEMVKEANKKGQRLRKQLFHVLTPEERKQLLKIYQKLSEEITK